MKHRLIPIQEVFDKYHTKEEQEEMERLVAMKIALRKLQETRKKLGYTQAYVAQISGLPRSTISKIESGFQNVSLNKIMKVAHALGKNVEIKLV